MVPNGSLKARPPANGLPPGAVWQAAQSAALVRYSPFATSADPVGCACVAWTASIEAGQKKKHAAGIATTTPRAHAAMRIRFMRSPVWKAGFGRSAGGGCEHRSLRRLHFRAL